MAVKIFAMNDCDWMAAETTEEAVTAYKANCCGDEFDDEQPVELDEETMHRLTFHDTKSNPPTKRTFREQLDKIIADGEKFPCFFASTEY